MNDRWVLGLDSAGNTLACTICDDKNASKYAKYYRGLKENGMKRFDSVRVFTYDEMMEHDKKVDEELQVLKKRIFYENN